MNNTITRIEEYIASFQDEKQAILQQLFDEISKIIPEAKQTINYKIPTFQLNGNIIQFAMLKNYINIYPGEEALNHFEDKLSDYKHTKTAFQIPLIQKLPINLIEEIINYNVNFYKDKTKTDWKKYNHQYDELNEKLQEIVNETELVKEFKWGGDIYTYNGKNVLAFSGFKNHFSLWFHQGVFLEDKDKVLMSANEGKTKGLRQWRFHSIADLDEKKVKAYIKEAIKNAKEGKEILVKKSAPLIIDDFFKSVLNEDKVFSECFNKLTPGRQKEYNEYISEAKQEKTKLTRLEKIKPMILVGKGLNDKYRK